MIPCGNPKCPTEFFTPKYAKQRYCSRQCHITANKPYRKALGKRMASVRAKQAAKVTSVPPETLERLGYVRGYQMARWKYHYRNFLKSLAVLLSDDAAARGAGPADTR